MEARIGGAWRTITSAEAYVGGAWRRLQYGEAFVDGQWRTIVSFAGELTGLTINPPFGSWGGTSTTITSGRHVASVSGGLSPFTYAWVKTGGDPMTIDNPHSAGTTFTGTTNGPGTSISATFKCTVTDSLGATASDTLTVTLTQTDIQTEPSGDGTTGPTGPGGEPL